MIFYHVISWLSNKSFLENSKLKQRIKTQCGKALLNPKDFALLIPFIDVSKNLIRRKRFFF